MQIKRFFGNRIVALKTFPIAHLILAFLTVYACYLIEVHASDNELKLLIAGLAGFLLSIV